MIARQHTVRRVYWDGSRRFVPNTATKQPRRASIGEMSRRLAKPPWDWVHHAPHEEWRNPRRFVPITATKAVRRTLPQIRPRTRWRWEDFAPAWWRNPRRPVPPGIASGALLRILVQEPFVGSEMRPIQKGSTNQSTTIRIVDATDGTPETGVTSATSGLALEYRREGAAAVSLTESDLTALTDAHSDGGMLHIGGGYYRVDLPDAAVASGADGVLVFGTVTGMVVIGSYHPLVAFDPQDAVRLGLTALPNANATAAGGLPVSAAGSLDLDAILEDTGTTIPGLIAALNNLSASGVNAEIVDALATDTYTEPGQVSPPSAPTIAQMLRFLYFWARNKVDTDGTTTQFYADDDSTVAQQQGITETSGTVTKSKITGGP